MAAQKFPDMDDYPMSELLIARDMYCTRMEAGQDPPTSVDFRRMFRCSPDKARDILEASKCYYHARCKGLVG